jgi:succinylarginine dihydrolase
VVRAFAKQNFFLLGSKTLVELAGQAKLREARDASVFHLSRWLGFRLSLSVLAIIRRPQPNLMRTKLSCGRYWAAAASTLARVAN